MLERKCLCHLDYFQRLVLSSPEECWLKHKNALRNPQQRSWDLRVSLS